MILQSLNEQDTLKIGEDLGKSFEHGVFIALYGDLGAGKTAFVRGLARGLGSDDSVSSPTFALMHEYSGGRLPLYHFDLYRIQGEEIYSLGFDEYFDNPQCVCAVEWCERLEPYMIPDNCMQVCIKKDGDKRTIEIKQNKEEP